MHLASTDAQPSTFDALLTETMVTVDPSVSERASQARHASNRRPKIDPTICERDYSSAEVELVQAMQAYKIASGRMFPTWSEVLEVLQSLGYKK
jgi:hypothetical protein